MSELLSRSMLQCFKEKKDPRGVYTLTVKVARRCRIRFGRKGLRLLRRGVYCYTGSALGRGSASLAGRLSRHLSCVKRRRWHIDYLLASRYTTVEGVILQITDLNEECRVNRRLESVSHELKELKGLGSGDCKDGCTAHLLYMGDIEPEIAVRLVVDMYRELAFNPIILEKFG